MKLATYWHTSGVVCELDGQECPYWHTLQAPPREGDGKSWPVVTEWILPNGKRIKHPTRLGRGSRVNVQGAPKPQQSYEPPPSHYATGGIDPWTYIESQQLDYWQGNIVKYITRAGRKDIAAKLDDLKKVRNFINKYIEIEEGKGDG